MGERRIECPVPHLEGAPLMDLKIAVCVPSNGMWTAKTSWSIAKMVDCFNACEYDHKKEVEIISATGSMLPEVRAKALAKAWKWEATHVLWVDSDMYFPHDTIQQMLSHGKAVVAANYVRRTLPTLPVAYVENDEHVGPCFTKEDSTGLEKVRHVGMGLMMTDINVYDAIELPFWNFTTIPPHNVVWQGEDTYFCRKLEAAGIDIWVDHDLSKLVEHVGLMPFTHQMADATASAEMEILNLRRSELAKEHGA